MQYWLFKSEPECFSWTNLMESPQQTTSWDGVRNYQARNFMRDAMRCGDLGLFYHSGKHPEVVGVVEIVREGYADHTARDPMGQHFDPAASEADPRWYMVDVRAVQGFAVPLARTVLRREPALAGMELLKTGSRLSVQPVEAAAFEHIVRLAEAVAQGQS